MLAAYGQAFPLGSLGAEGSVFRSGSSSLLAGGSAVVDHEHIAAAIGQRSLDAASERSCIEYADQMKNRYQHSEASIKAHIKGSGQQAPRYRILRIRPSHCPVNAAMLCCHDAGTRLIGNRRRPCLIGLAEAIQRRQSARRRGQVQHIRGGRRRPRDTLYMAAMSAIRWNPDMKAVS